MPPAQELQDFAESSTNSNYIGFLPCRNILPSFPPLLLIPVFGRPPIMAPAMKPRYVLAKTTQTLPPFPSPRRKRKRSAQSSCQSMCFESDFRYRTRSAVKKSINIAHVKDTSICWPPSPPLTSVFDSPSLKGNEHSPPTPSADVIPSSSSTHRSGFSLNDLQSPVEIVFDSYDPELGAKVCRAFKIKAQAEEMGRIWREQRYGTSIAREHVRGTTPDAIRARSRREEDEKLGAYEAELEDTDDEDGVVDGMQSGKEKKCKI